jgi:acetyl-CoA carboxylase carboxyltransferase component
MGPEGAVNVIHRKELAATDAPEQLRADLVADYRAQFANPYVAAARGYLDAVIAPRETRPRLIAALKMAASKRASLPMKKHSNIPL